LQTAEADARIEVAGAAARNPVLTQPIGFSESCAVKILTPPLLGIELDVPPARYAQTAGRRSWAA